MNPARFRLFLCALLFAVIAITSVCVRASLEWVGQPFNGFLMGRNRIVAPIDLPSWSGRRSNIPYWWQLVSVDGTPVTSTAQAHAAARRAGAGANLVYGFSDGAATVEVEIPVMTFEVADWIGLFANYLVNGLALLAIGFFVAFLRPELKSAHALLFFSLSWGTSLVIGLADFASFHFRTLLAIAEGFVPASLFYLTLCFPSERPLARRRRMLWFVVGSSAVLAALNVVLYEAAPHAWTVAYRAGVVWVGFVILLSVRIAWREQRRTASGIAREKLKIVLLGILAAFGLPFILLAISQLVGAELPLNIVTAGWWIFPATLAYAIVQRDLFQIDVFLRRVATYTALSTVVFVLYAAILAFFHYTFHNQGLATSPWFTLLFSLTVLVAFHPLRDWLQAAVDRLFFRTHFDYADTTRGLSQALNQTLGAADIAKVVGDVIRRTMSPVDTDLYRYRDGAFTVVGDSAGPPAIRLAPETSGALTQGRILEVGELPADTASQLPATAVLLPLSFEGRLAGMLRIGPKQSGATYGPRDLALLKTVANQTAMALRNASSYNQVTELLSSLESRVEERTHELQETQTELRASNEKLLELDRVKTQFFADASHELRTPLTLVLGPLEELSRRAGETRDGMPDDWRRLADLARSNAATLLVLTDTLLDISRIDSGQAQPKPRAEAVAPLVEATAEPFRWLAEQRGVELRTHVEPGTTAHCDRAMTVKILGNLLANALKFTLDGAVELRAFGDGERVAIEIADTGPGIAPDEIGFIFDRYRQASTAARSSFAGSGIGLALVRELTEVQGGTVRVRSEVGAGTTFRIDLPSHSANAANAEGSEDVNAASRLGETADPDLAALAAAARARPLATGDSPPATDHAQPGVERILVIDDNPDMLDFVRQVVGGRYRVQTATNADDALAALRLSTDTDLIVSDVMMPGPDGIALCQTLKNDPDLGHIPLILLTARASLDSKLSGLAAGADDYITKPFHPDELMARIAALLRMRRMERELRQSHGRLSLAYDELRDAQAQLAHSEKMAALGTLVAGVAHEINNPVSFIHSSIDLITTSIEEIKEIVETHLRAETAATSTKDGAAAPSALREAIGDGERFANLLDNAQICKEGAQRTARIVQDLRAFSRPSTNGRQPTDLHELLDQSLRLLQGEIKGRITVQRDYGELPRVRCDPGQISQVFLNLLANAAQAIPDKGAVSVGTSCDGQTVEIRVTDTGPGMTDDTAQKIFDPFFTTKDVGKGTGLGLSIVQSLIHSHGGEVRVDSAVDRGTTFTVILPTNGVAHEHLDISA